MKKLLPLTVQHFMINIVQRSQYWIIVTNESQTSTTALCNHRRAECQLGVSLTRPTARYIRTAATCFRRVAAWPSYKQEYNISALSWTLVFVVLQWKQIYLCELIVHYNEINLISMDLWLMIINQIDLFTTVHDERKE